MIIITVSFFYATISSVFSISTLFYPSISSLESFSPPCLPILPTTRSSWVCPHISVRDIPSERLGRQSFIAVEETTHLGEDNFEITG